MNILKVISRYLKLNKLDTLTEEQVCELENMEFIFDRDLFKENDIDMTGVHINHPGYFKSMRMIP